MTETFSSAFPNAAPFMHEGEEALLHKPSVILNVFVGAGCFAFIFGCALAGLGFAISGGVGNAAARQVQPAIVRWDATSSSPKLAIYSDQSLTQPAAAAPSVAVDYLFSYPL